MARRDRVGYHLYVGGTPHQIQDYLTQWCHVDVKKHGTDPSGTPYCKAQDAKQVSPRCHPASYKEQNHLCLCILRHKSTISLPFPSCVSLYHKTAMCPKAHLPRFVCRSVVCNCQSFYPQQMPFTPLNENAQGKRNCSELQLSSGYEDSFSPSLQRKRNETKIY